MEEKRNIRLMALELLVDCEKNNIFVKDALNAQLSQKQFMSKQDRSFFTRLVEGVTEYQVRLDYIINQYSKTKVQKCKPVIRHILRMGVYQMLYMDRVPNQVACDECVKLARKKKFHNLTGFVNGVLRNISNNIDHMEFPREEEDAVLAISVAYSTPAWLVEALIQWYGKEDAKIILASWLDTKDITIRINTNLIKKEELQGLLQEQSIRVKAGDYVEEALHIEGINYIRRTKGFKEGYFFVQDESSMLLYHSVKDFIRKQLEEKDAICILDLCGAPGGKSTHFAQMLGEKAEIETRDLTKEKVNRIEENLLRLQLDGVTTKVYDATQFDKEKVEWADIVIADLPCSGLGIVAKKNDIKYHASMEGLQSLVKLQREILTQAQHYVKPGGILIFSTCTIYPGENQENAVWIKENLPFVPYNMTNGIPQELQEYITDQYMLKLLSGKVKCDGFFISTFMKKEC